MDYEEQQASLDPTRQGARAGLGQGASPLFPDARQTPPGALPFRAEMERAFGEDFSSVQVFLGDSEHAERLNAEAAVSGEGILFSAASPSRGLVAHELAHVVQNRRAGVTGAGASGERVGRSSAAEAEADRVASQVLAGEPVEVEAAPAAGIQRVADAGLAEDGALTGFGDDVARVVDGHHGLTIGDFDQAAEDYVRGTLLVGVNNILAAAGCTEALGWDERGAADDSSGTFLHQTWEMRISKAFIATQLRGTHSVRAETANAARNELKSAAATVYHEARHAEQTYRAARYRAGVLQRKRNQTIPATMAAEMSIPIEVTRLAAAAALTRTTGHEEEFDEAKEWHRWTTDRGRTAYARMMQLYDEVDLDVLYPGLVQFSREYRNGDYDTEPLNDQTLYSDVALSGEQTTLSDYLDQGKKYVSWFDKYHAVSVEEDAHDAQDRLEAHFGVEVSSVGERQLRDDIARSLAPLRTAISRIKTVRRKRAIRGFFRTLCG